MEKLASFDEIHRHLKNIPINKILKVELLEIGNGYCEVRMPYNEDLTNSWHSTHGGILMTLADMSFYLAQATLNDLDATGKVSTAEVKTNFLKSNFANQIRAHAQVIKNGKRIIFGQVTCLDELDDIISHSTVSYIRI